MNVRKTFSENLTRLLEEQGAERYQLADYVGINYDSVTKWLLGLAFPRPDALEKTAEFFGVEPSALLSDHAPTNPKAVRINVYGSIPAGVPMEAVEDVVDWEEIPTEWTRGGREYFALIVSGDSMYPEYLDGDVIIVRRQNDFENGEDCVVMVNGYDATLKRLYRLDGGVTLRPLNPAYPPKTYRVGDEPILVVGVVAELRRKK